MKLFRQTSKFVFNLILIFSLLCSNIFTYKFFGQQLPLLKKVDDTSSIYSPDDAVDLIIRIAKKICVKTTSANTSAADFDNIIADCLSNLKNSHTKYENNLKNFWNIVTEYVKKKGDAEKKNISQNLMDDLFSLVRFNNVKIDKNHGSSCGNMIVINTFDQSAVLPEIEQFLSKFNLADRPKTPFLSSFIGPHRNLADPSFIGKFNAPPKK